MAERALGHASTAGEHFVRQRDSGASLFAISQKQAEMKWSEENHELLNPDPSQAIARPGQSTKLEQR